MEELTSKYEENVLKTLDKENFENIIFFLRKKNCIFINDLIENYLDLFTINYEDFVNRYNELNEKYNNKFLELVSLDMNLLEEFY